MKKILALSLTFALFACGGSHRSEADLVIDFKHKKEVFDMNWNSGKIDKLKLESDSTLQIAEEIIAEYPAAAEMPDVLFNAGDVSSKMENYEKAVVYYSSFVEKFPQHENASYALWLLAYQYELMNNIDKAIETFQSVRKNYPDSPWEENAKTKILDLNDVKERAKEDAQIKQAFDSLESSMK
jgi:outer membrane protein assembly factor BamD (BamD/ComL family)